MSSFNSTSKNADEITNRTSRIPSYMDGIENLSSFAEFYDKARQTASRDACGIRGETVTPAYGTKEDTTPPAYYSAERSTSAAYRTKEDTTTSAYYSSERSASADYRNFEARNPPTTLFPSEDRSAHACNRLYKTGVRKEKVKAADRERTPADTRNYDQSDSFSLYEDRSTQACHRLYNRGIQKEKLKAQNVREDVDRLKLSTEFRNFDPSDPYSDDRSTVACNRLYKMGVHNEKLKAQNLKQAKRVEEKLHQQNEKLEISTRSYTPLKARPYERKIASLGNQSTVHNYLFHLSKDKHADADREKHSDVSVGVDKALSTKEKQKVVHRLYSRSRSRQKDGRERREKVEIALAPKPRAPTKTISQDKATAFFDRQMAHKAARDQRIADAQVNRPPRSNAQDSNCDLSGERSQTPSRLRSMTPDRVRAPRAVRTMSTMRSRSPLSTRLNTSSGGRSQSQNRRRTQDSWEGRTKASQGSLMPLTRSASPGRNFRSLPSDR